MQTRSGSFALSYKLTCEVEHVVSKPPLDCLCIAPRSPGRVVEHPLLEPAPHLEQLAILWEAHAEEGAVTLCSDRAAQCQHDGTDNASTAEGAVMLHLNRGAQCKQEGTDQASTAEGAAILHAKVGSWCATLKPGF
mgnify:CR=1 FL=1